ncbi:unnamed protein product [Chrysoparadoxa australica]
MPGLGQSQLLALPWHEFADAPITINNTTIVINEVSNSGQGTGLNVWDGGALLANYLKHQSEVDMHGARVLELGAGTGVSGLSAALLGANVVLTDLEYTLPNLEANVAANELGPPQVTVQKVDWFSPPEFEGTFDLVLMADVVWMDDLVTPLVETMEVIPCNRKVWNFQSTTHSSSSSCNHVWSLPQCPVGDK